MAKQRRSTAEVIRSLGGEIAGANEEPAGPDEVVTGRSGAQIRVGQEGVPITEGNQVPVGEFYASSIQGFADSNDFTLVLGRPVPFMIGSAPGTAKMPGLAVHFSPQTAKDLFVLLRGLLERHEKEWGRLETSYTRRIDGPKPKKNKKK